MRHRRSNRARFSGVARSAATPCTDPSLGLSGETRFRLPGLHTSERSRRQNGGGNPHDGKGSPQLCCGRIAHQYLDVDQLRRTSPASTTHVNPAQHDDVPLGVFGRYALRRCFATTATDEQSQNRRKDDRDLAVVLPPVFADTNSHDDKRRSVNPLGESDSRPIHPIQHETWPINGSVSRPGKSHSLE